MTARRRTTLSLIALLALIPATPVTAQDAGPLVERGGRVTEDLYVAGGDVRIAVDSNADVIAAGGQVTIGDRIGGDVMAAGGQLEITGQVLDDVRIAGGLVQLNAQIGDDAIAAGGHVVLAPRASVGGRAWLSGGSVDVYGQVGRELRVAAESVTLGGEVRGNVELVAEHVRLLPSTHILGSLTYYSPRAATLESGARIEGETVHKPVEEFMAHGPRSRGAGALVVLLALLLTGLVLFALLPGPAGRAAAHVGLSPWASLGLGAATLLITPLAAALLLVTVVGWPLAVLLMAIYLLMLTAGFYVGALFLGDAGLRRLRPDRHDDRNWRLLALAAVLGILALIGAIPVVGGLALLAVLLTGLGALLQYGWAEWPATPARTARAPARNAARRKPPARPRR